MRLVPVLLMFGLPMLELGLLIKTGQAIGFWWTCAIVIGTATLGAAIISRQGMATPFKVQEALAKGEPPGPKVFDSALAVTGGVLLLTPGLLADAIGLLLQIPPVRGLIGRWLMRRFFGIEQVNVGPRGRQGAPRSPGQGSAGGTDRGSGAKGSDGRGSTTAGSERPADGPVIEGEFERLGERTIDPKRPRPNGADRT